jgi:hypothetical protein
VWPIWLAHVREMQPLIPMFSKNPLTAIAIAAFPMAALVAAIVLLRSDLRRDFGYLAATGAFAIAFLTTLAAVKAYSYAIWLGMPLVAAFALHLFAALRLHSLVPRFAVGLLLTPAALSLGAMGIAQAAGIDDRESLARPESAICLKTENYPPIARLPAGLIAADTDFGPFLLALTPHAILAAPYHRLSVGIIASHRIFASVPPEARRLLSEFGATYLLTCGTAAPKDLAGSRLEGSLWGRLQAKDVPDWLEPVETGGPFAVYRVRPAS